MYVNADVDILTCSTCSLMLMIMLMFYPTWDPYLVAVPHLHTVWFLAIVRIAVFLNYFRFYFLCGWRMFIMYSFQWTHSSIIMGKIISMVLFCLCVCYYGYGHEFNAMIPILMKNSNFYLGQYLLLSWSVSCSAVHYYPLPDQWTTLGPHSQSEDESHPSKFKQGLITLNINLTACLFTIHLKSGFFMEMTF